MHVTEVHIFYLKQLSLTVVEIGLLKYFLFENKMVLSDLGNLSSFKQNIPNKNMQDTC